MKKEYYHSVTLDKKRCKGCTNCIKRCPTEAIRVRDGKAHIINERCIDCGECVRVCPYHAKVAVTDPLSFIHRFKYKIALPAPTLYGQFKNLKNLNKLLVSLKNIGFDDVFEVARGADYVTHFIKEELNRPEREHPLISSACPAIVRLIQVRFPELINNIIPVESPMEVAAQIAKKEFCEKNHVHPDEVGTFFITPCAAKVTSIKNPIGRSKSSVDGAISILDVYGPLVNELRKPDNALTFQKATSFGIGWANSTGESKALGIDNYLAVDGINNVIKVLEEVENGKLTDLDFLEALSCTGGCVGGPLVFENNFVAKNRIKKLVEQVHNEKLSDGEIKTAESSIIWKFEKHVLPKPVMKLDENITVAIQKMELMEKIHKGLPGLDCGSCGSPSCRTLAEDIVRGRASEMDCIFKLREKVKKMAQEMIELAEKIPTRGEGGETSED